MSKIQKALPIVKAALKSGLDALEKLASVPSRRAVSERSWLRHYDLGVPHEIVVPDYPVSRLMLDAARENGKGAAIYYFGRKITYNHLNKLVLRFAAGLKKNEVGVGDRVAICLPNIPQFLVCYWAALYIGAVVVPINPLLSEREIHHQLSHSSAKVIIVLDRIYPRVARIQSETSLRKVIIACLETYMPPFLNLAFQFQKRLQKTQEKITQSPGTVFFRKLLQENPLRSIADRKNDDPALLIYTGGVTGTPKAAVLSHKNLLANVLQAQAWINDLQVSNEIFLAALPFIHSYGMTACHHLAMQTRSALVLEPRFDAKRVVRDIKKYKVTMFPGVPTMYSAIVTRLSGRSMNLTTLRACISGGAPLPQGLRKQFEELTNSRLIEGYGLTEASPITHCNPIRGTVKDGSIGVPWPSTEARIADLRSGKPVPYGDIGELQVRGPQVMTGYWQEDEENKQIFTEDGWMRTGDIARCDEDGYFYIVDRKKDIIFSGGYNIYPSEIEKVLMEHPKVTEASAIGVADDYYGEKVKAFVTLAAGECATEKELLQFCHRKLAKFKIPKEIVFKSDLPKTLLGKVLKRELVKSTLLETDVDGKT
jgi:long-chain acyl-CoA synthetase